MQKTIIVLLLLLIGFTSIAIGNELISESPIDAKVYFIEPIDGQIVPQRFKVKFGLIAMGVAPAGVKYKNTGHHHILIDNEVLPNMTNPLPATDTIKHFGGGQTETELMLSPGKHNLQLLLGNFVHIPHNKPVLSEKITITVR